jgi:hypothetical protein
VPILLGFLICLRNRFTLAFRQPITIAATGQAIVADAVNRKRRQRGAPAIMQRTGWEGVGKTGRASSTPAWNEGVGEHVRTRFHSKP